jgi:hypothetical protein
VRIVAILEVQWGGRRASRWFQINPYNHSGKRLIQLIGHDRFDVTNACPECVSDANGRGKPDPVWLRTNLRLMNPDVVIVCGRVARETFKRNMVHDDAQVIHIPHPAARTWTKNAIKRTAKRIQRFTTL